MKKHLIYAAEYFSALFSKHANPEQDNTKILLTTQRTNYLIPT